MNRAHRIGYACVVAVFGALCATACTTVLPSFAGGTTTPKGKTELTAGAVAQSSTATPAPVVAARHGAGHHWDVGIVAAPALARLDVRFGWTLLHNRVTKLSLITSASPYGGYYEVEDRTASRQLSMHHYGMEVPLMLALQASDIYEFWAGTRAGVEYADGTIEPASGTSASTNVEGWGPWIAGVAGMGIGFGHLHFLVEVTARYTAWEASATTSFAPQSRHVDWIPAFGVRLRL